MDTDELLRPYVPKLVIDWLRDSPDALWREVDGSLAFVDISGFTKLTERLARAGKVGAEEMSDLLNATFGELIAVARDHGADLVKWGGDAVLLLFQGDAHAPAACRAAYEMRRTMRRIGRLTTSVGQVRLRMSVGVHSGPVHFTFAGSQHRELIVSGPTASLAAAMESIADAGEIVVSAETARLLEQKAVGEAKDAGWLLRTAPRYELAARQGEQPADGLDLAACLPLPIRDHLLARHGENEHRKVAVAFVEFSGADALMEQKGPQALADAVQHVVETAQDAAHRYGVTFFESDIGRDGGKIMMVAGAPRSTGEEEERMLLAARAILERQGELGIRIGINCGRVFAGDFGPPYRRTYSVKGDAINLAARVMGKAAVGQVLATHAVVAASTLTFRTTALPPFQVKGKALPVHARDIGPLEQADTGDRHRQLPLVGRQRELAMLLEALGRKGKVVTISGEAGSGKSRLAAELVANCTGEQIVKVVGDAYAADTPYALAGSLMRSVLGFSAGDAGGEVLDRVERAVRDGAAQLTPWLPLLAQVVGESLPATPEIHALEDRFRKTRLEEASVELLRVLLDGPSLIVIDDAHLSDDASADLLAALARAVPERPWVLVVVRRPVEGGFTVSESDPLIALQSLDDYAAMQILELETDQQPLPPHALSLLAERAAGNPLFLRELAAAATQTGGDVEQLPDSIEGLFNTQIDQLDPADRTVLRSAAVLGIQVNTVLLAEMLGDAAPDAAAWRRLGSLLEAEPGGYRFRHALIRDSAYEGLPFRRRRTLHKLAADAIERRAGSRTDEQAPLLARHYFHAGHHRAAYRYARLAGERAARLYANAEAAGFFSQALVAGKRLADLESLELAGVHEALGDVLYQLGEFAAAGNAYADARRLAGADPVRLARLRLGAALVAVRFAAFPQALQWLTRGQRGLEGTAGESAAQMAARLTVRAALVRHMQGRDLDVVALCERGIAQAEASGARDVLAQALQFLDAAHVALGRLDGESHAVRSLAIFEELGNLSGQAKVLNQLGIRAYFQGRWQEARTYYQRARDAFERVGDRWNAAISAGNAAEILSDQGHLEEAEPILRDALRVWRAAQSGSEIAFGVSLLGRLQARMGRFEEALELLAEARAMFVASGEQGELIETDARIAECLVLQGQSSEALEFVTQTLARVAATPGVAPQLPLLHRLRGYAHVQIGDLTTARVALEESLHAARSRSAEHEEALTLEALTRLDSALGLPVDAAREEARAALFDRLGIVATPEVPLEEAGTTT